MTNYFSIPFAIALLLAVGWTTLFSMSNKRGIRGFRNFGILASYLLPPLFLVISGWQQTLVTWAVFGVAGGMIYIGWELIERFRTPSGEEKPRISLSHLIYGLLAWPIMVPEAVEYLLADLGILSAGPSPATLETAVPDAANAPPSDEKSGNL